MAARTGCYCRGQGEASPIDTPPTLCSWGANGYGQLGQGHTLDKLLPVQVTSDLLPPEFHSGVSLIGGGGGFSFLLTGAGNLLTCGNNDKGQLGLGPAKERDEEGAAKPLAETPKIEVFTLCSVLASVRVVKAAAGWDFVLALSDDGMVYSWGSNAFGQLGRCLKQSNSRKKTSTPEQICFPSGCSQRDIAAGLRHGLSISAENDVYAWGHGKRGQLGSEIVAERKSASIAATPQAVPVPGTEQMKSVVAGMYHSGVLTELGSLYLWGCNAYSQCGLQPEEVLNVPCPRKLCISLHSQEERVVAVCSGWTHLVARTDEGNLYTWGRANLGQLGRHSDAVCDPVPALVDGLTHITQHMCGSEHNIALSGTTMYAWGWNEHGICATGDEENVPRPRPLSLLPSLRPECPVRVTEIGCGAGHTFCLVDQHESGGLSSSSS